MKCTCNNLIDKISQKYGFTLKVPGWWRKYCVFSRSCTIRQAEANLNFKFRYRGKVHSNIFSIVVLKMTKREWKSEGLDSSPLTYIASRNGRVFAYLTPEELPEKFLKEDGTDYDYVKYGREIAILKRMVNHDVPRIIKSFKWSQQ